MVLLLVEMHHNSLWSSDNCSSKDFAAGRVWRQILHKVVSSYLLLSTDFNRWTTKTIWGFCKKLFNTRASLIHFACIGVAPFHCSRRRQKACKRPGKEKGLLPRVGGSNSNAGKIDQTWSNLTPNYSLSILINDDIVYENSCTYPNIADSINADRVVTVIAWSLQWCCEVPTVPNGVGVWSDTHPNA